MPRENGTPFRLDLAGKKFGRWTVLKNCGSGLYLCRCECGTEKLQYSSPLTRGASKSCGCRGKDWCRKHGMEATPIYNAWAGMKQRCQNPNYHGFKDYGGRGIKVCERWQDFQNFYADMGDKPEGKSLNRIDNDGDYEPDNVVWSTNNEQAHNRRSTIRVDGDSIASLARQNGLSPKLVRYRVQAGYSLKQALSKSNLLKEGWKRRRKRI